MALDKAGLTSKLTEIFEDLSGKTAAQKAAEMATAIDTYVKTAKLTVPGAGLVAPANGGTVSGTSITGNLS